ncbi:Putative coat protein [Lentibacillus persicus]|uniref:Putative coat protein n=1 Tax=Lentibacillus persicus TaxID=640948 RepID=A0A1I1VJ61_9BACI|nr:spore coat protein YlbD [Lentibacillus persicus]SFD82954.1 Putative coat protein [Lentibacillus persicus]
MSDNLHPSVKEFKAFLQRHPELVKEARKHGKGFQTYYEKWALLGEDDPFWDQYKGKDNGTTSDNKNDGKKEIIERLVRMSENIDMEKLQKQMDNVNQTISTVQGLLGQFQSSQHQSKPPFRNHHLFDSFKD